MAPKAIHTILSTSFYPTLQHPENFDISLLQTIQGVMNLQGRYNHLSINL